MDVYQSTLKRAKEIYGVETFRTGEPITSISNEQEELYMKVIWIAYLTSNVGEIAVSVIHTNKNKAGIVLPMQENYESIPVLSPIGSRKPVMLSDWVDPVYTYLSKINLVSSNSWAPTFDGDMLSIKLYIVGGCTTSEVTIMPNPQDESVNKLCLSILASAIHIAKVSKFSRLKSKLEKIPKPIIVN